MSCECLKAYRSMGVSYSSCCCCVVVCVRCVLNSTWWDMWKEYVNYPERQGVDTEQAGCVASASSIDVLKCVGTHASDLRVTLKCGIGI